MNVYTYIVRHSHNHSNNVYQQCNLGHVYKIEYYTVIKVDTMIQDFNIKTSQSYDIKK